jgi:Bacterial Ig-like domain (group 3)
MKGLTLKWASTGRLGRTVLTLGAAGACVGGMLLIAAPANAVVGTDPTLGTVELSPTTGTSATTTTFGTSDGCPTGFQNSAELYAVNYGSSPATFTAVSGVVTLSGSNPIAAGQGLQDTVLNLLSDVGVPNGGTDEWVVKCSSIGSALGSVANGTAVYYQDIDVNLSSDGTTYTVSTPAPAVNTTTVLSASPSSAAVGATVTLTATVTAANGTSPAGTVTFFNGSTAINSTPATVTYSGATGTATTTTTFAAAGTESLSATFTPTNSTGYNASTSAALSYTVVASGTQTAGTVPVSVTIASTGTFTVTIPTTAATLTPNSAGTSATGSLGTVTVTDSRNTFPGWAVYGEETTNFVGSGLPSGATITDIPSDDLGWQPAGTVEGGATLGPSAADIGATAGPAVLAQALAGAGFGTDALDPTLTLTIPSGTPAGTYTGGVVITYIEVAP